jgi:outer membrane protein OmpA-like peptidoglycan-associated protein
MNQPEITAADRELLAERAEAINYWPALLDVVTSSLMMFVLIAFLQSSFSLENLDALAIHRLQNRFLALLDREFAAEKAAGVLRTERHLDFLQITFSDRLLFDSGEYQLQPAGEAMLARCARLLTLAGFSSYRQIQVEGHTDDRTFARNRYPKNNWELSTARALSVLEQLSASTHLPAQLFSANGYADHRPVASNLTVGGRALNRRIELRIFFAGAALSPWTPTRLAAAAAPIPTP